MLEKMIKYRLEMVGPYQRKDRLQVLLVEQLDGYVGQPGPGGNSLGQEQLATAEGQPPTERVTGWVGFRNSLAPGLHDTKDRLKLAKNI